MRVEVESRRRSFDIQQVVRAAMLKAQELYLDHPEQALEVIEEGLGKAPRDETLMQARARLEGHLRDLAADAARKKALSNAHSLLESKNYAEAQGILVTAIRTQGPNADFEQLLALAKREQAQQERKQAEILGASSIPTRSAAPVPVPVFEMASVDKAAKLESQPPFRVQLEFAISRASRMLSWRRIPLVGTPIVVLALATGGVLHHLAHRETPASNSVTKAAEAASVPAAVPTYMEINASPWARVVQVLDSEGKSIRLPEDSTTPLRLGDMKTGQYNITLVGPNGDKQIVMCSISATEHSCILQIEVPDMQQVITGANP
jgi:serine/threonine-protein kinase